eukprot:m.50705 g.50705  ORF g.50705 m.50705 type:complete len:454 (+) comp7527_c0_seq2:66-1427(+)
MDNSSITSSDTRTVPPRFGRNRRTKSSIDQTQVADALKTRRRSIANKRARNMTVVIGATEPSLQPQLGVPHESIAQINENIVELNREVEMRRAIMTLQKQHILDLQEEMKEGRADNLLLLQSLASREQTISELHLKIEMLSGDTDKMMEMGNVHHLERMQAQLENQQQYIEELEGERQDVNEKLENVLSLVEQLTHSIPKQNEVQAQKTFEAIGNALKLQSDDDKYIQLETIRDQIRLEWRRVDAEIEKQNQDLDDFLDSVTPTLGSDEEDDVLAQLAYIQQRIRPQLRSLLKTSNDIRIRSTAIANSPNISRKKVDLSASFSNYTSTSGLMKRQSPIPTVYSASSRPKSAPHNKSFVRNSSLNFSLSNKNGSMERTTGITRSGRSNTSVSIPSKVPSSTSTPSQRKKEPYKSLLQRYTEEQRIQHSNNFQRPNNTAFPRRPRTANGSFLSTY